ncbi:epimerase, partial [Francisella tularensis subsp. holarctica]|nr:epimerase [Francisella tularensis subsp. holarctica]
INASAIGYYNFSKLAQYEDNHDRSYDKLTFGQKVVDQWEKFLVDSHLQRYIIIRFVVVIGNVGVLEKMALPEKILFLN